MSDTDKLIEVMEAAYEKSKCRHPDALHDRPMKAALSALTASGYAVVLQEPTPMTNPDDLVARLRRVADFGGTHLDGLWTEAADTIEELEGMHKAATADCIRANDEADKLSHALLFLVGHRS